jgi:hypothetical protein
MNTHSKSHDGFNELMQTQRIEEVPSFLESRIMQHIEVISAQKAIPFKLQPIFVFGILSSAYIIFSYIIFYYFPYSKGLYDCKNILLASIIIHIIYEANEALPKWFEQNNFFKHRFLKN